MFSTNYKSPIGNISIVTDDDFILKIIFSDQPVEEHPNRLTALVTGQFDEYFFGTRKSFQLPLAKHGTEFQHKVLSLVKDVPFGKTLTYTELSVQFGDKKAIRAVAAANGKNQFAIVVPCHRIVGASGKLTGYAWGMQKKAWLLAHEGSGTLNLF